MKNIKFSRLFAAALLVACFAFAGCKPQVEEVTVEKVIVVKELSASNTIVGKWVDNYTSYNTYSTNPSDTYDCKISSNGVETASYGVHNGPVYISMTSDNSGYLYYQFKSSITGYDSSWNPFTVEATGKWGAIAFQNLTTDSVQMCDFADSTYELPETLEACVKKYTKDAGSFENMITFTRPSAD